MSEQEKTLEESPPDDSTTLNWVAGKTRYGKPIVIKPVGNGLFYIEMQGGGKKPTEFKSLYTSIEMAQVGVDSYLSRNSYTTRQQVEERNAKKAG